MRSVVEEIFKLRNGTPVTVDRHNGNRYRLVVSEEDGSKTAYYFSAPIYNLQSKKLIDMSFIQNSDAICAVGSHADITVSDVLLMKNHEFGVSVKLPQRAALLSSKEVCSGAWTMYPTTNGVAIKCPAGSSFIIETNQTHLNIRTNDRCFALMKEAFMPLFVVSCIGALDATGNVISPAKLDYQQVTDKTYRVVVSAMDPLAHSVFFEMNLYENKLFQDTTVESVNYLMNNAFGSVGFIGRSCAYGEQWLYSKPDYARMTEMLDKRIDKVILHIPVFNQNNAELSAFKATARFCSFGSNWNNKIARGRLVAESMTANGYKSLDITDLVVEPHTQTLARTDGLILKSKTKGNGFVVVSTADSSYAPQILEIRYR